jgi:molybdopterin synthase sulfur carrier subunit
MIRVVLPTHLRELARTSREIQIRVDGSISIVTVLDALENAYPMLRGTIRDQNTKQRRPFIRFFACGQDYSHISPDDLLPDKIVSGTEPLRIVGAMAGG